MKLVIDNEAGVLTVTDGDARMTVALYSDEAFGILSAAWLKIGWNQKYTYTFTWLGRPVIQLPEDLLRLQEVIYQVRPDVVIETGVAHGGSAVFNASICHALGKGRVIGIDILIRPENRRAIESHELASLITLIEGGSTEHSTVEKVRLLIAPGEVVLVVLDSRHDKSHVRQELELYAPFVSKGSYIVATDGIMRSLADVPRGRKEWTTDNPAQAAIEFAREHTEFTVEPPRWSFNESSLTTNVTHWPDAWLRRT